MTAAAIAETLAAARIDPRTDAEWTAHLARHGGPLVIYRGHRIAHPVGACSLTGGALDQTQVPCVAELVLGVLCRDWLARRRIVGWEQHQRSITAAARHAPAFVERIERSVVWTIEEHEIEALLTPQ